VRFLNLEQGSKEWLEFRRGGLGASDAPVVTRKSQYKTRRQLWENKLGLRLDDGESFITEIGHRLEPKARARFALETGIDVRPACAVHDEFAYLRASFDGICDMARVFVEIKLVGQKKLAWIKENKSPLPEHVDQIGQQFLVSNFERGFYAAYTTNENYDDIVDYFCIPVAPNRAHHEQLFSELTAFWKLVETQTPPELELRDEYEFKAPEVIKLANDYKIMKEAVASHQAKLEELEMKLKAIASQHSRVRFGDVVVVTGTRKGAVEYDKIPELKSVNLEQFRKPPIKTQSIQIKGHK
jgi:putative phage-type endonuclease